MVPPWCATKINERLNTRQATGNESLPWAKMGGTEGGCGQMPRDVDGRLGRPPFERIMYSHLVSCLAARSPAPTIPGFDTLEEAWSVMTFSVGPIIDSRDVSPGSCCISVPPKSQTFVGGACISPSFSRVGSSWLTAYPHRSAIQPSPWHCSHSAKVQNRLLQSMYQGSPGLCRSSAHAFYHTGDLAPWFVP